LITQNMRVHEKIWLKLTSYSRLSRDFKCWKQDQDVSERRQNDKIKKKSTGATLHDQNRVKLGLSICSVTRWECMEK